MKNLLKRLWQNINSFIKHHLVEISGYIAYEILLSFVPFIILLVAITSIIGKTELAQNFIEQMYLTLPAEIVETISPIVREVIRVKHKTFFTLSIAAIVWILTSAVEAMRTGLNISYKIVEKRPLWSRRLQSLGVVVITLLTVLLASFAMIIVPIIMKYMTYDYILPVKFSWSINLTRYLFTMVIVTLTLTTLYRWLPNHKIRYKKCLPGAIFASITWMLLASLFSLYFKHFGRYNIIYGSLGGIMLTLLFFQLSALIVLYGAHFNVMLSHTKR